VIPWFQCTAFELKAIANLPNKLRKRFVAARELQLVRELDTLPGFTESELIELESTGIATRLEILCPRLLKERGRQVRKKTKEDETATRVAPVSDPVPARARPVQTERQSREEKTDTQKPARPSAPRYAVSKKECMRQWNAAVTAVTGEASCQTSLALETKAQEFHKAVSAAGETFEDVVRRRVRLGRTRLGLWSAMNDYNDDVRAEKATGPRPVAKANEQGDWLGIPKGKVAP